MQTGPFLTFKTLRVAKEFHDKLNTTLRQITESVVERWGPQVVTHVWRSQAEQDKIYGSNPKYKKAPWVSVHQDIPSRGVDLRLTRISPMIAAWVNRWWSYNPKRPKLKCAIIHDVGAGNHMHLQVHPNTLKNKVSE